jgi:hypothetical protein
MCVERVKSRHVRERESVCVCVRKAWGSSMCVCSMCDYVCVCVCVAFV